MKAFVFDGKPRLVEMEKPAPSKEEALIKVRLAGICKTDLEIIKGYMDFQGVLGHEFVGSVEEARDETIIGRRVVGEINAGCGACSYCYRGLQRHCPNRTVMGILGRAGAMAEYLTLPLENLSVVPENVSDEKAAFTEPMAAALEILEQIKIEPNHRILVVGDGKLGLLVSMVLRLTGCDLLCVGKHDNKLKLLNDLAINTIKLDSVDQLGREFDMVVEASGNPGGWSLAVSKVKPRGAIVLKSTYHGAFDFNPAPLVIDEITVIGSRCGVFEPALRLMQRGLIDPLPLLSDILPLEKAEEAFQKSQDKGILKILLSI